MSAQGRGSCAGKRQGQNSKFKQPGRALTKVKRADGMPMYVVCNGGGEPAGCVLPIPRGLYAVVLKPDTFVRSSRFAQNVDLVEVVLPAGFIVIGVNAFIDCTSLTKVTLPPTLSTINGAAFCGCTALQSIALPVGLETIGAWAFENCTALRTVEFPAGLKAIGSNAFRGCTSLAEVKLPKGPISVADDAFSPTTRIVHT